MANVKQAIDFVMRQEDSAMSGVITNARGDHGGRTRWGISENAHPELTASGFFGDMSVWDSLKAAEDVYAKFYAAPLKLDQITSQGLATALLSFSVLEGQERAVKMLQHCLGVMEDGYLGPQTVAAINRASEFAIMQAYGLQQRAYFMRLAAINPTQAKWVVGWGNRMSAVERLVTT